MHPHNDISKTYILTHVYTIYYLGMRSSLVNTEDRYFCQSSASLKDIVNR